MFTEFPVLEVFVSCGLILLKGDRAVCVSVCVSVALSSRVGSIKKERGKKENKPQTREETRNSFITLQGTKGFGWNWWADTGERRKPGGLLPLPFFPTIF